MFDLVLVLATAAFFAICIAYVRAVDRM